MRWTNSRETTMNQTRTLSVSQSDLARAERRVNVSWVTGTP